MRHWIAVVALTIVLPCVTAFAQPMLDRVPANAMIYIGWRGGSNLGAAYQNSHLKAVLDNSDAQKLLSQFLPALARRVSQKSRDAGQVFDMISALGQPMWEHPTAFYFAGIEKAEGNARHPQPQFALFCKAGADAPKLLENVNHLLAQIHPPFHLSAKVDGDTFVLSSMVDPLAKPAANLATSASFNSALAQVQKNAVLTVYVNSQPLLDLIGKFVKNEQAQPGEANKWTKLRESLGLNGLRQIAITGGFEGKNWSTRAFVGAPAPRQGILAMLAGKPVTDEILKTVPKSATFLSASFFDVSALVNGVRQIATDIDPRSGEKIDQILAMGSDMVGTNIQTELIDALGNQWSLYFAPDVGGNGLLGMILVNRVRDAAKLERSLARVETAINTMIASNLREPDAPKVTFRQVQSGDLTIHYLAVPFLAPGWAIKDGNLYVGAFPQTILAASRATANGSILDNEAFKAMREKLDGDHASSIRFINLPRLAPDNYTMSLAYSRLLLGMADLFGVPAPALVVPPLDKLLPELEPAGSISRMDDAGYHYHGITPFPGATVLGSQTQAMLGQQALLISILLPSLNRARETANRVKCASNERQIGQALVMYANEHNGMFPPDLGTLIKTEDIQVDAFVCPSGDASVPSGLAAKGPDAIADWVNKNSDYIYVTGKNNATPADVVVVYEKPGDHGHDGMNILYGDGHVEWQIMPAAVRELQRCNIPVPAGMMPAH